MFIPPEISCRHSLPPPSTRSVTAEGGHFVFFFYFLAIPHGSSPPGIEPVPPAWKHGLLTTGPPGMSQGVATLNNAPL